MFSIDVDNPPFSTKIYTITGPTGLEINDFAYRVADGKFYGVASDKRLVTIEITGGTTATISTQVLSGPLTNSSLSDFTAAWISLSDEFFVFNKYNGIFYRVDLQTLATTNVRTSVSSLFNDGMSCPIVALPLELVTFEARPSQNKTVQLGWTTINENKVSHFELMRSSNGNEWKTVGKVDARNRLAANYYEFTDTPSYAEQLYYKLKIIDNDGTSRYSKLVAVKMPARKSLLVYPNPANNQLIVNTDYDQTYRIEIFDQTGRLIQRNAATTASSSLEISHLASGRYFLKVISGKEVEMEKFTKL